MSIRSAVWAIGFLASTTLLAGCGGAAGGAVSSPTSPPTKGSSADLRGGWLIAGTMPFSQLTSGGPGLVVNLDLVEGQVTGYASLELPCSLGAASTGGVGGATRLLSAPVAADGTFTLTDTLLGSSTQHQILVQGTVPATVGGSWSGTYTLAVPGGSCNGAAVPSQSGTFTAQRIADLTGTYAGQGRLNNTSAVAQFAATLQQGGAASLNGLTPALNDQSVLNGTLAVQGIPCFRSGSVKSPSGFPEGSLTGNVALLEFLMDDGSTVVLTGNEGDLAASTLTGVTLLVLGGACDKTSSSPGTATRQ